MNLTELKHLRGAYHIPNESAEGTLKTFHLSSKNLHSENTTSIDFFLKLCFKHFMLFAHLISLMMKMELIRNISPAKKARGLEIGKQKSHYLL